MPPRKRQKGEDAIESGNLEGGSTMKAKGKKVKEPANMNSSSKNMLMALPLELINPILDRIQDSRSINALCQTCKQMYKIMMPRLYKRIAVAAMFHAHISALIRTLEPHLSIVQRKMLKKEGQYKGQQETYPRGLNDKAIPFCASYVRQVVVGVADPGKKHQYIVVRYIEEALRNMKNVEIVETRLYSKSIGQSLAAMKDLQALNLNSSFAEAEEEDWTPLTSIKNLKHLTLQVAHIPSVPSRDRSAILSLLWNSRSTLQSLSLSTGMAGANFFEHWDVEDTAEGFTALKSLSLNHIAFESHHIKILSDIFDFSRLLKLTLDDILDTDFLLLKHLASFAGKPLGLQMQSLNLSMASSPYVDALGLAEAELKARVDFISSFDTLTELILPDYGQYPSSLDHNPGLSDLLLKAILKHKNLKVLRLTYVGITSGLKIPYLSAKTVDKIVSDLPDLEYFEFAPEEEEMDKIGHALAKGTNLNTIICYPHTSYMSLPSTDSSPGLGILSSVIKAFLSHCGDATLNDTSGSFVWEEHYKLRRFSLQWKAWDIASFFGKGEKGMRKPEKLQTYLDGQKREVSYRDITATFNRQIHVGFDPDHDWVKKAEKNLL